MFDRSIESLIPKMRPVALEHQRRAELAGVPFIITCTAREFMVQHALYAQGRCSLKYVNACRKAVGLWGITEKENRKTVTKTLKSKHIVNTSDLESGNDFSKAYDIALKDAQTGKVHWDIKVDVNDNEKSDYQEIRQIGQDLGLVTIKWDWPHFQAPNDLNKLWTPAV